MAKLWQLFEQTNRPVTAADLTIGVYEENTPSYYYTVLKILDSLEAKGLVRRDRSRRRHLFEPGKDRVDVIYNSLVTYGEKLGLSGVENLGRFVECVVLALRRLGGEALLVERLERAGILASSFAQATGDQKSSKGPRRLTPSHRD